MALTIKPEAINRKVVFGTFTGSLENATEAQLRQLAIIALKSGDQSLIELFEGEITELSVLQDENIAAGGG